VDNIVPSSGVTTSNNRIDVLYIQLSESVLLNAATISKWSSDFDVSFWVGTSDEEPSTLLGMSLADLTDVALADVRYDDFWTPVPGQTYGNGYSRDVDFENTHEIVTPVSWMAFGAAVTGSNDAFKFKLLAVTPTEVPTPGVLYLLGAGALGLRLVRRRLR
jgi:hypothetical protein